MDAPAPVTRFAPSPTGWLHLGHAHSALFAWSLAKRQAGRFLLRIEDIDRARVRPEFEAAILEDLAWLGLAWEAPVRRQSDHFADYAAALGRLEAEGLLYPCFCTRAEIAAAGLGRMPVEPALLGDVVLARKDTPASYHLAVCVDDALQGVTLVTRGEDLLPATHVHRLLQALLGLPEPAYHHHRLLTDESGRRLSKRQGDLALRSLRAAGASVGEVRARAGFPEPP